MKAVLLISHGSRSAKTKQEVEALVQILKSRSGVSIFEYAFLEIEMPDIAMGLESCVAKGATDIIVLLNFLNAGRHVNDDIPQIVAEVKQKYPHIKFSISSPVGQHPQIADLFIDLIAHA